jgi:hypothetical protein
MTPSWGWWATRDRCRASVAARARVDASNEKFSLRLCVLYARVAMRDDAASMGANVRVRSSSSGARPRVGFGGLFSDYPWRVGRARACVGGARRDCACVITCALCVRARSRVGARACGAGCVIHTRGVGRRDASARSTRAKGRRGFSDAVAGEAREM